MNTYVHACTTVIRSSLVCYTPDSLENKAVLRWHILLDEVLDDQLPHLPKLSPIELLVLKVYVYS